MEKTKGKPYKKIDKQIVKNPITFVHPEFEEEQNQAGEADVRQVETVETIDDAVEIPVEVEDDKNKEEL
jgi:hypothetical protein